MNQHLKEKVIRNLSWDFKFEDEFKTNAHGYTFIIDVLNGAAMVSLYRFSQYGCKSEPLEEKQPPMDMLKKALTEQGNELMGDGFYYLDQDLKHWVEREILKIA
ncbi:hypothetical protein V6C27_04070 [Peptococcaceae bacterium 1198_IL3148]